MQFVRADLLGDLKNNVFQALQVGMINPRHQYIITNLVSVSSLIILHYTRWPKINCVIVQSLHLNHSRSVLLICLHFLTQI